MRSMRDIFSAWRRALTPLPTISDEDAEYQSVIEAAEEEARDILEAAGVPRQIGYTEIYHEAKQHVLKSKYGLRWKPTPPVRRTK